MQPNAATIIAELKSFLKEAGDLALSIQQSAARSEKADASIVTEADIAISDLFQQRFVTYLSQPGHMLVDEEVAKQSLEDVFAADYQWVVDPIDGTASYAGYSFTWGIIVSIFRKGEPWLGAIYVPAMELLYIADETTVSESLHAFTLNESTRVLEPISMPFSRSSQINIHFEFLPQIFTEVPFIPVDYWSPLHGGLVAAGRLRGTIFKDSLWDFGASMVMAARMGYKFRRIKDGMVFTKLESELLNSDWKLKDHMFIGPDEIFEKLKPYLNKL